MKITKNTHSIFDKKLNPHNFRNKKQNYLHYFHDEPGNEPGTIRINPLAKPSQITLIEYNKERVAHYVNIQPFQCAFCVENEDISWLDIQGLGTIEILTEIGKIFNLYPLVLEDVVNVPQRPKIEEYKHQLLLIIQIVHSTSNQQGFQSEQISFVLGKDYLLTFQENSTNYFDKISDRLKLNQGKVRQLGADYLMYLLLDRVIDSYFPVLEDYGERIETLENKIVENPTKNILEEIYYIRRELLALRRSIWPLRSILTTLSQDEITLITSEVRMDFRDCYDHVIQLLDIVEIYRELSSSLMEVYLSSISNTMNEIMSFLTLISTIFIPLTFIAGIYGMNFEYMPELKWKFGYFLCLALMLLIASGLVLFFKRRGWFKLLPQKIKNS